MRVWAAGMVRKALDAHLPPPKLTFGQYYSLVMTAAKVRSIEQPQPQPQMPPQPEPVAPPAVTPAAVTPTTALADPDVAKELATLRAALETAQDQARRERIEYETQIDTLVAKRAAAERRVELLEAALRDAGLEPPPEPDPTAPEPEPEPPEPELVPPVIDSERNVRIDGCVT
jgi:hypothetical protein